MVGAGQLAAGDVEDDLMRALSEIPPMKLAGIDEAFVLLGGGLGAVFSASTARRAASRGKSPGSSRAGPPKAEAGGPGPRGGASRLGPSLTAHKAGDLPEATRGRGASAMRQAVTRLSAPMRRLAAQKVTMHMFEALCDDSGPTRRALSLLPGPAIAERVAGHQGSGGGALVNSGRVSVSAAIAEGAAELSDEEPRQRRPACLAGPGEAATASPPVDLALQSWAQEHLALPLERLRGLEASRPFREKLVHQMLCWQAMRSNDLQLPHVPALDDEPLGIAPAPALLTARESLFGLVHHLEDHEGRKRRQPLRDAGTSSAPSCPAPQGGGPAGGRDSTGHSVRDQAHIAASSRQARRACAARAAVQGQAAAAEPSSPLGLAAASMQAIGTTASYVPRPARHVEPHCELMSTDLCGTPEFVYLRRCEMAGLVPCQSAWRHFGGSVGLIDVTNRALNDADICVVVETAIQCARGGHPWKALNLGGNALTDAGLWRVAQLLVGSSEVCEGLQALGLAGNSHLRLRAEGLLPGLAAALSALPALTSLDLSGVAIRGQAAVTLATALERCPLLRSLGLAGCGLGHTDQAECVAIAGLLGCGAGGARAGVEIADLSGNFFGRAGFAAVAAALRSSRLRSLSFAGNGGGHRPALEGGPGPGQAGGKEQPPRFQPLQLLLESLHVNATIERLDLSGCGLGPETAFVLEDALHAHSCIKNLVLDDNPLGDNGLRCIIRLLICRASPVTSCDVCGHREADAMAHEVKFRYTQPGGMYSLDLRLPRERATLRMLLRFGGRLHGSALRFFKFDARQPKPNVDRDPETDSWVVPSSGIYSFAFQPPVSEAAHKLLLHAAQAQQLRGSAGMASSCIEAAAGPKPASRGAARRQSTWIASANVDNTPPTQQAVGGGTCRRGQQDGASVGGAPSLLQAGRQSVALGRAAEGAAASSRGPALPRIAAAPEAQVDAAVLEDDGGELAGLLRDARIQISALRFPLLRTMYLSLITGDQQRRFIRACSKEMSFNAAQVLQLCEDRPELGREVLCDLFPSIRGRSSQLMLLGGASASNAPRICKAVGPFLWFHEGNLTGRYRLNLSEPADCVVAENCLLVNAWEVEVGRLVGRPDVSQRGNYEMLRNEEHNEVPFAYGRDWSLPSHGCLRFDYSSIRRPPASTSPMPEASEVARYLRTNAYSAAAKLKALRAISVHMYLSAQQFKSLALCFPEGVDRQDLFCALHTRIVDPGHLLGPAVLHAPAVLGQQDRDEVLKRIGHLHLFNPLQPDHVSYTCQLMVYEERMVIEFLVQLTIKEAGGKVIRECEDWHAALPASWADKGVPSEDVALRCSYDTTNVNAQWRQQLAEKYCVGVFCAEK